MPRITIIIGGLLIILGGAAYISQMGQENSSWTALIPAILGLPVVICGVLAMKPDARKAAMHFAMLLAFLGVLAPLGRLIPSSMKNGFELDTATGTMLGMMILSAILLVLGIRSFVDARKAKSAT
ncbi:MAG: hypothetical protein MK085_08845 [Phycisphaerales bacterium]|nr:hypothetical protein [Phycisphaerales bacterium]